jgi:hypothetical protein
MGTRRAVGGGTRSGPPSNSAAMVVDSTSGREGMSSVRTRRRGGSPAPRDGSPAPSRRQRYGGACDPVGRLADMEPYAAATSPTVTAGAPRAGAPGTTDRHVLVAVAWPYANGLSHLGHIAGCYLPADVFARYHRIVGNRALMVSGTDAHGTPITVLAEQEGVSPAEIVERFNPRFQEQWERLGISFDLFTSTMTDNHREVTGEIFRGLRTRLPRGPHDRADVRPGGRPLPPRPLRRGHLPVLRRDGRPWRPVRHLRQDPRPGRPHRPTLQAHGCDAPAPSDRALFILLSKLEDEVLAYLETVRAGAATSSTGRSASSRTVSTTARSPATSAGGCRSPTISVWPTRTASASTSGSRP